MAVLSIRMRHPPFTPLQQLCTGPTVIPIITSITIPILTIMVTGMADTGENIATMMTTGGTVDESTGAETDLRVETIRGFHQEGRRWDRF